MFLSSTPQSLFYLSIPLQLYGRPISSLLGSCVVSCPQQSHSLLHRVKLTVSHTCLQLALHWVPSVFRTKTKVLAVAYKVGIWPDSPLLASLTPALSTLATIVFPQPLRFTSFHIRTFTQVLPSASNPWPVPLPLVDVYSSLRVQTRRLHLKEAFLILLQRRGQAPSTLHSIKPFPSSLYPNCTELLACTLSLPCSKCSLYIFKINCEQLG